jgi:hypothetical protein
LICKEINFSTLPVCNFLLQYILLIFDLAGWPHGGWPENDSAGISRCRQGCAIDALDERIIGLVGKSMA